ncbi:MAG: hypothetical protein OXG88_01360 [Gammaproteobacteria bacterium]|nr:hypothetical protein [Gammaproteobacteria bacterium]MDE2739521.1 hypothetical protein [Paracoccaceae bacterium]
MFRFHFKTNRLREIGLILALGLIFVTLALVALAPMIRHILWCIGAAADSGSAIALLIVGLIIPPIGWIHGVSLLLGFGGWIF